jgi:hypothetical protein
MALSGAQPELEAATMSRPRLLAAADPAVSAANRPVD